MITTNLDNQKWYKKIYEGFKQWKEAVIIFPTIEISRASTKGIKDLVGIKGFLNFAQNTNAPITTNIFRCKNSKTFYTISLLVKHSNTTSFTWDVLEKI